ncbi:MAG: TonB-dependent receptor domain-containing protein [Bacteroidales bacterium]
MKKQFIYILFTLFTLSTFAQHRLKGLVKDEETNENIIGCTVLLQGTTKGGVTDMDGKFSIQNVASGTYNLLVQFISYEKQLIKVRVPQGNDSLIIKLKPAAIQMKDVVVTATRKTDTELSMLNRTRIMTSVANGITAQQIARSQDKDASEVIRRIPGVSIRDGKFVIVRGLTERYNSVWLNGSSTPSSESDVRAFSFDVIPSGQIDNILIYKSPAPELPADFAGAMINIKTKSLIDKNSISFSYSYGFHQGTTGKDFFTYKGGKTDWLGFDDGTRAIPGVIGSTEQFQNATSIPSNATPSQITEIHNKITSLSQSFNTILTPSKTVAAPDADFQLGINKRFTVGPFSIGSITSLGYNSTNTTQNSERPGFESFGFQAYSNNQSSYMSKVRVSALSNWVFLFGNNQKIEFRNLFNNYGMNKTVFNNMNYNSVVGVRSYELSYESRMTYSGQLAGYHTFNNDKSKLDWTLAYSYANKDQPDLRRVSSSLRLEESEPASKYELDVPSLSRLYLNNQEHQQNASMNYVRKFQFGKFKPELKAGVYFEHKTRNFTSRKFEYKKKTGFNVYLDKTILSYRDSASYTETMMNSIQNFFNNKIGYNEGIVMEESTDKADSYDAQNDLVAGYIAANIPFSSWANVYLGVRAEKNSQTLSSFKRDGSSNTPFTINNDTLDLFPSVNATFNITKNLLFRAAVGQTVNRPEFREISPFAFYSFEENTFIFGNEKLKNCYITNADARFEWYPTPDEIISIGAFFKDFKNPIEQHIIYVGGASWNYTFFNAESAKSYGAELDIRKRLHELENTGAFSFLSNFTFVVNASLIKSELNVEDSKTERTGKRELQGQSPYIINLGTYYQSDKSNLMMSLMYNKVGKRISFVGDPNTPHVYEMPFNSLDFTLEKKLTKWASLKFGVKNLLDNDVVFQQTDEWDDKVLNTETNVVETVHKSKEEIRQKYKPGMQIKLGINMSF